ncbi:hypothetical protein CEXT_348541 [Caerostris extrusa]|uniref:Uncharacterized protein n=1 Tax=Caerostris extrusa TaxID=172846 RepID=A0AAV4Y9G4_CAEEX|nr:hypothetical protein CEXT_348541 [Caerostris extrusa]
MTQIIRFTKSFRYDINSLPFVTELSCSHLRFKLLSQPSSHSREAILLFKLLALKDARCCCRSRLYSAAALAVRQKEWSGRDEVLLLYAARGWLVYV